MKTPSSNIKYVELPNWLDATTDRKLLILLIVMQTTIFKQHYFFITFKKHNL